MKHILSVALMSVLAVTATGQVNAKIKNKNALSTQTVKYHCQGEEGLVINYGVNGYGVITTASFNANDENITATLDQDNSDNIDRIFKGQGYTVNTDYIDIGNLRKVGGVNVTAPSNEIIFKDCRPY